MRYALIKLRYSNYLLFEVDRETDTRFYGQVVGEKKRYFRRGGYVDKYFEVVKYPATEQDLRDAEAARIKRDLAIGEARKQFAEEIARIQQRETVGSEEQE